MSHAVGSGYVGAYHRRWSCAVAARDHDIVAGTPELTETLHAGCSAFSLQTLETLKVLRCEDLFTVMAMAMAMAMGMAMAMAMAMGMAMAMTMGIGMGWVAIPYGDGDGDGDGQMGMGMGM